MNRLIGAAIATAAAGLFSLVPVSGAIAAEGKIVCDGVNACKGRGDCKTASNACKGQNACRGKGFLALTPKQCEEARAKAKRG
jgi:hypothetical protein